VSDEQKSIWKKELSLGRKKETRPDAPARTQLDDELAEIKAAAIAAVTPEPAKTEPPRAVKPLPAEPVDEPRDEKVPFWKKELSLGGKGGAPKQAKEPKPKEPKQKRERSKRDADAVPFWKKELSLGKKTAAVEKVNELDPIESPATTAGFETTLASVRSGDDERSRPFWRKEIAIGPRRPKPKQSKQSKEKNEKIAAEGEAKPKHRRTVKMPRLERPARRVRRDKSGRPVRQKRLVGLKVGASQIAAARVSNNGAAEVLQLARTELETGVVVGGELREPEKLAEALRDFFKEHNLPKRGVRLGIANNRIGVRSFDIVGIEDAKQLENAVKFRAQEALPIPIEEAVLDYQILGETKNDEGQSVKRILLVVAYRELVDRYVVACRKAGVELVGIDLEAFALLRALSTPREVDAPGDAAVVVVSIGHERSTFAVSDGRVCEFTRVLEWGGSALNVALARALDTAPSEAEPWKRALDLHATVAPAGWTEQQFAAAHDAARRQIQSFARELVSSLQFYQNQPGSLGIGEIVLTGGTAHLPGLAEELQRLIGVAVRLGNPLGRVKVGKKVADEEQIGSLAVAIGLGIED
jgi:type IV pilus assembly protein PilM